MNWKDIKKLIRRELNEATTVEAGGSKFNLRTGVNKNPTKLGIKIQFEPASGAEMDRDTKNALEIAFSGEEGAVDRARTLLNDFAKYFPTNDSGTSVLKNHPEFLKIKNQFEKDMLELEDDILDNTEKLNKEQLQNTAYNLLSNPDTTAQDVQNFLQQNPSSDIADYMNETVVLARPETFNRLDQLEINALTEGFYPNKLTAMQELRSWYNSTLKLPSQREAFLRVKQSIDENFSGELSSLTKNKNYINGEIAAEFKTNDGLDFQKARDGINMRDIQRETTKKLDAFYKREAGKGTPPSEAEIRNEAERLAEFTAPHLVRWAKDFDEKYPWLDNQLNKKNAKKKEEK